MHEVYPHPGLTPRTSLPHPGLKLWSHTRTLLSLIPRPHPKIEFFVWDLGMRLGLSLSPPGLIPRTLLVTPWSHSQDPPCHPLVSFPGPSLPPPGLIPRTLLATPWSHSQDPPCHPLVSFPGPSLQCCFSYLKLK